jgi:hypothetical protein
MVRTTSGSWDDNINGRVCVLGLSQYHVSMFYYDLLRVYFQDNKEMCYVNVDSSVSVNIDGLRDSPE